MSAYELGPRLGTFDFVFCGDLLLHLKDPITPVERIHSVCTGSAVIVNPIKRFRRYRDRPALDLIAAQQVRTAPAAEHRFELPAKVHCVLHAGIHAKRTGWRCQMDRVAGSPHVRVPFCGEPAPFPLGPATLARATGTPLRVGRSDAVVEVRVVDRGREDRLMAVALVTVKVIDPDWRSDSMS